MTNIIVCCDGLDPAYLDATDTPGWDAVAVEGRSGTCRCVIPSLTNVNNLSIATGSFPETHGVTGNTYYDRANDERVYMEDPSFLRCETRFERAEAGGERVGVLVVKEKLRRMVGRRCAVAVSAEDAPGWLERAVGPAPDIYSGDASPWLMEAAAAVLESHDLDWLYVSTTDVIPHKHAPAEEAATEWVRAMDGGIATLHGRADDLLVTADHGMSHKTLCLDVEALLEESGHDATVIRLIRDRHTYHHQNLGGAAYVYLPDDADGAGDRLRGVDGVDLVLSTEEAADRFRLPPDRIGDLMVLGSEETVFGPLEGDVRGEVDLRSHGSHHEQTVPFATTVDAGLSVNLGAFDLLG